MKRPMRYRVIALKCHLAIRQQGRVVEISTKQYNYVSSHIIKSLDLYEAVLNFTPL